MRAGALAERLTCRPQATVFVSSAAYGAESAPADLHSAAVQLPPLQREFRARVVQRAAASAKNSLFAGREPRKPAAAVYRSCVEPGNSQNEPKPQLLVIDDDQELCAMLVEYLGPEGFVTSTATTGLEGLEQLAGSPVDLVILDVMLPQLSGFEVLRRIRAMSRVPVIMLTARGEEVDRVVGLEMGADDYLAKPFSPRELVARIRAVMRRVPGEAAGGSAPIVWGPLRLDLRAHRAEAADKDLELTSAELRILELLVRADTRTVTRDELMEQALGRRLLPTDRSLDTHVSNLRRKIARCTDRVNVQSVRGSGYALTLVSARTASAAPTD